MNNLENSQARTAVTNTKEWLKKDLIFVLTVNIIFLGGLLILFKLNQTNHTVEKTIGNWIGL